MTNTASISTPGGEQIALQKTANAAPDFMAPSLPVSYCHPSSLAAAVQLFNLSPPPVENARVLELGCADGGNIIPLAAQMPKARFLGIDLSQSLVQLAGKRIAGLGLRNVSVQQADLLTANFGAQEFDYILCHGVFSWVPKEVQDAVLRICAKHLSPAGAAVVSFNVLPGWHLRRVVRDICVLHAGVNGTPLERAARARQALTEIAKGTKGQEVYAALLRAEAQRLQKMPPAYIINEFLAPINQPSHFTEFYTRAKQSGLAYLCDAEITASLPEFVAPSAAQQIRAMGRGSAGATQQYIDFFTGRPFRRAVLVKDGRMEIEPLALDPAKLRSLHFSAELSLDRRPQQTPPGTKAPAQSAPGFLDARGRRLAANNARAHAMLMKLAGAFPSTLSLGELLAGETVTPELERETLNALLAMIGRNQAAVFSAPLKVGRGTTDKPLAWPVARQDALAPQSWVTSLHHRAVRKIPSLSQILHLMDGTKTRTELQAVIEVAIQNGKLTAPKRANGSQTPALSSARELNNAIAYAARNGLLLN